MIGGKESMKGERGRGSACGRRIRNRPRHQKQEGKSVNAKMTRAKHERNPKCKTHDNSNEQHGTTHIRFVQNQGHAMNDRRQTAIRQYRRRHITITPSTTGRRNTEEEKNPDV